jgi:alpha,alpha-trehalose phosphorylase
VAIFGFAGLSWAEDTPSFDPLLPEAWQTLSFAMQWRGRKIHISIGSGRFQAVLRDGLSMPLIVRGNAHHVHPGQPLTVALDK